jgi:hypothetical protein
MTWETDLIKYRREKADYQERRSLTLWQFINRELKAEYEAI